ncbi:hypothetical protein EST38_g7616 [Candolleomyces aberdarensis]|uniref:protein-tyrosine-phosphatase n=1 Tax=Candolleomyces aberdarensis TaxID=2316362 RepID=A0A4Q2DF75_9AGAR|nr:hypothetical protein EST38_g7616 [Candolleomyces aberdarensis]
MVRRRGLPAALRIDAPTQNPHIAVVLDDAQPDSPGPDGPTPPSSRPSSRASSMRNAKRLSISIPSAGSSDGSLPSPAKSSAIPQSSLLRPERPRRPSVVSLPAASNPLTSLLHRKDEDGGAEDVPYADGPVQIIPGIWIGSEENARDWKGLMERGIKAILNVAKEVSSPFDNAPRGLRTVSSTPNFRRSQQSDSTYYPPHLPSGRPGMHYLKLEWSHGQQDLVNNGFQAAMSFVDDALARSEGVLVHCQCGISRSATMVIALVMRAAAERSPHVPPEVWALKGMQGAYAFVKEKSPVVGPNMSLILQLVDYEKMLRGETSSPGSDDSFAKDAEWGRRRQEMEQCSSPEEESMDNSAIMQEARALDKAMEDRIVARKASTSSIGSTGSGIGMGHAWRSRYGSRKRTGSIASNHTSNSIISEDLLEEDEEEALLGVGGGFDSERPGKGLVAEETSSASNSPDDDNDDASDIPPFTAKALPPPPAPRTAVRSSFDIPPRPLAKPKKRPFSISVLPPVPSSPIVIEQDSEPSAPVAASLPLPRIRKRAESTRLIPPPLSLRNPVRRASATSDTSLLAAVNTPSQTLFVFPPSPTLTTRTPSTMTLTSEAANGPVPFPTISTPRISAFLQKGALGFSKVDARGYFGLPS